MGLTGSGGALVAIPLFMTMTGAGLKEASIFSLIAVALASLINLYPVRQKINTKLSFILFTSSLLGSWSTVPIKAKVSDMALAMLLSAVALFGVFMTWKKRPEACEPKLNVNIPITLLAGFLLGMLTTLTGLGGGVMLMPLLTGVFHLLTPVALATSLLTIFLSASASFVMQLANAPDLPQSSSLLIMSLGLVFSVQLLKVFTRLIPEGRMENIRKSIYTLIVALALVKIF